MANLMFGLDNLNNFINSTVNNALNVANDTIAQINSSLLGIPATINIGAAGFLSIASPVGPGVTLNLPSNTGSLLAVLDPIHFQGTINFYVPGGAPPGGSPSQVQFTGVPADSWSLTNNTLTLYAHGQPTDTVKVIPDPVGFGVYATPNGAVISSSVVTTALPPSVVPLPGHV